MPLTILLSCKLPELYLTHPHLSIRLASHPTLYSSFFGSLFWNSWSVSWPLYRDYENQTDKRRQESYDHSDNDQELHSLDFPDIFSQSIQLLWWRLSSVAAILIGISNINSLYCCISRRLVLDDVFIYFIDFNSCFGLQLEVDFLWPCWCQRLWWRLSSVAAILIRISNINSSYSYISCRLALDDVFIYFIDFHSCFGLQFEVDVLWPCWCRIHGGQPSELFNLLLTFKRLNAFKTSSKF